MPRQKQPEEVMSLTKLQKFLKMGHGNALELLTTGKIPAQKLGTRWRIHRDAAIAWLNSGGKEANQQPAPPKTNKKGGK